MKTDRILRRLRCLLTLAHWRERYGVSVRYEPYPPPTRGVRAVSYCKGCGCEINLAAIRGRK